MPRIESAKNTLRGCLNYICQRDFIFHSAHFFLTFMPLM
jgi:hypothetical protein